VRVVVRSDDLISEKHALRIERMRHGNVQVTSIDADFVLSNDYACWPTRPPPSRA
jgi:DNA gyrase subunit B